MRTPVLGAGLQRRIGHGPRPGGTAQPSRGEPQGGRGRCPERRRKMVDEAEPGTPRLCEDSRTQTGPRLPSGWRDLDGEG